MCITAVNPFHVCSNICIQKHIRDETRRAGKFDFIVYTSSGCETGVCRLCTIYDINMRGDVGGGSGPERGNPFRIFVNSPVKLLYRYRIMHIHIVHYLYRVNRSVRVRIRVCCFLKKLSIKPNTICTDTICGEYKNYYYNTVHRKRATVEVRSS